MTPTPRATRRPSADYKITAEALRVASELVRVLRPAPPQVDFADFQAFVPPLFACAKARLLAQDQDQEVKECAISCMGLVLSHLGDACAAEVPAVLPILLERLRNEITRVTTVKTFQQLATATMDMQLAPVLQPVVAELCSFLRKASRPLRQTSLGALDTIVLNHAAKLGATDIAAILEELPVLVCDSDLHVAHLALQARRPGLAPAPPPACAPPSGPAVCPPPAPSRAVRHVAPVRTRADSPSLSLFTHARRVSPPSTRRRCAARWRRRRARRPCR